MSYRILDRAGWLYTSFTVFSLFATLGYISFLINKCKSYDYCPTIHDYSARYTNYTITNSTISYTFMALRDSRPFQEYVCDSEQITDMSRVNRYIMKYLTTQTYTIYVQDTDICTMKKPFSVVTGLYVGIGVIIFLSFCCMGCCAIFIKEDYKHRHEANNIQPIVTQYFTFNIVPVNPITVTVHAPFSVPLTDSTPTLVEPSKKADGLNTTCNICMDAQIGTVFSGCGHTICNGCATKLVECPMCRKVSPKIHLYT